MADEKEVRALPHTLLLTGAPGIGKTTLLRKVALSLKNKGLRGFYTEELRSGGERRGFRLVTFGGEERVMAHVDFSSPQRVGKYGVDVAAVDALVDRALAMAPGVDFYLVDEIGRMECLSARFVACMREILDGRKPVVASIAKKGNGFIAEVKRRKEAVLWTISRENRDALPDKVVDWLEERN